MKNQYNQTGPVMEGPNDGNFMENQLLPDTSVNVMDASPPRAKPRPQRGKISGPSLDLKLKAENTGLSSYGKQATSLATTSNAQEAKLLSYNDVDSMGVILASHLDQNVHFDIRKANFVVSHLSSKEASYRDPLKRVCLKTGFVEVYNPLEGQWCPTGQFVRPLLLSGSDAKLYYAIHAAISLCLDRGEYLREPVSRLIETAVVARDPLYGDVSSAISNPREYLNSPTEIMSKCWDKQGMNDKLFIIADDPTNAKFYLYSRGKLPPYKLATNTEITAFCTTWLHKMWGNSAPHGCRSTNFVSCFTEHLCETRSITTENFENEIRLLGVPFENGFAHIQKGGKHVELMPYSNQTIVTQAPIRAKYTRPVIKNGEIELSYGAKLYLENLTCNNPLAYSALRLTIRNTILSQYEGTAFQSALWLCGPPACSKSLIARILKRFSNPERVGEYAHGINNFTNSQLIGKDLVVYSDLVTVSKDQYQNLKPLLGRDQINVEYKFRNQSRVYTSHHVMVFVSNISPNEVPHLRSDAAVLQKLITVKFPPESALPPELQSPTALEEMEPFLGEIMNWALYCPPGILTQNLRAKNLNDYSQQQQGVDAQTGFKNFLAEKFCYSSHKDAFTPIQEIITLMNQYTVETGYDIANEVTYGHAEKLSFYTLGPKIQAIVSQCFSRTVFAQRYKRRSEATRPYGIYHLVLKSTAQKNPEWASEDLKYSFEVKPAEVCGPFDATEVIAWLPEPSVDGSAGVENQERIRERRLSLMPKTITSEDYVAEPQKSPATSSEEAKVQFEGKDADFQNKFLAKAKKVRNPKST